MATRAPLSDSSKLRALLTTTSALSRAMLTIGTTTAKTPSRIVTSMERMTVRKLRARVLLSVLLQAVLSAF
jgi:hypothetical protein